MDKNNRYLIVGGPGSGKTTLVHSMAQLGFQTVQEAAYQVVERNLKEGNSNLPWGNRHAFDSEVFVIMLNDYFVDNLSNPVFYDGGLLDILAWESFLGFDYTRFQRFPDIYKYENTVFLLEPWEDIYARNRIRNFSFNDAKKVYESVKKFYMEFGYKIVKVEKNTTVSQRTEQILSKIKMDS